MWVRVPPPAPTEAVASRRWLVANYSIDIMREVIETPSSHSQSDRSESEQKNPW
jgi:hypothetical protein